MIDKWDIKYIIRRVVVAIVITILLSLLGACNAKADSLAPATLQYYKPNRTNTWTRNPVSMTNQGQTFYHTSTTSLNDIAGIYGVVNNQVSGSYFTFNAIIPPYDYYLVGEIQLLDGSFVSCNTNALATSGSDSYFYTFTCETVEAVQVYKYGVYVTSATGYGVMESSFALSKLAGFEDKGEYNQYLINLQQSITGVGAQAHQDAQQQHQDLQDINNSLNNDTAPTNNEISGNTTEWNNKNISNNTITQLLTMPLTLINAYLNGINGTCSSFNLGALYGTDLVLPCINVANIIGSTLWSTIDILFSGFMIFNIGRKLIKIFNDFTNLNSNQVDELYGGGA